VEEEQEGFQQLVSRFDTSNMEETLKRRKRRAEEQELTSPGYKRGATSRAQRRWQAFSVHLTSTHYPFSQYHHHHHHHHQPADVSERLLTHRGRSNHDSLAKAQKREWFRKNRRGVKAYFSSSAPSPSDVLD